MFASVYGQCNMYLDQINMVIDKINTSKQDIKKLIKDIKTMQESKIQDKRSPNKKTRRNMLKSITRRVQRCTV
jgi:murein L,D-transpeptidase YafK